MRINGKLLKMILEIKLKITGWYRKVCSHLAPMQRFNARDNPLYYKKKSSLLANYWTRWFMRIILRIWTDQTLTIRGDSQWNPAWCILINNNGLLMLLICIQNWRFLGVMNKVGADWRCQPVILRFCIWSGYSEHLIMNNPPWHWYLKSASCYRYSVLMTNM